MDILAFTSQKSESKLRVLCEAALETTAEKEHVSKKSGNRKVRPARDLCSEQWNIDAQFNRTNSLDDSCSNEYKPALSPSDFTPLYAQMEPLLVVL